MESLDRSDFKDSILGKRVSVTADTLSVELLSERRILIHQPTGALHRAHHLMMSIAVRTSRLNPLRH